jgi:hypothetical protein
MEIGQLTLGFGLAAASLFALAWLRLPGLKFAAASFPDLKRSRVGPSTSTSRSPPSRGARQYDKLSSASTSSSSSPRPSPTPSSAHGTKATPTGRGTKAAAKPKPKRHAPPGDVADVLERFAVEAL